MNDNLIFIKKNAPRLHQAIITKLIYGLTDLYKNRKTKFFAYPETMIDESETSPVPDVMLIDPDTGLSHVIIEITHTQGVKKDIKKLQELMQNYGVGEGFVYNYKQKQWYKCRLDLEGVAENISFCDTINYDLDELLFD